MSSHYTKAYFLLSVADVKQLPADNGLEVAIVGRSNAGKSSVLNCITKNKGLARVSKTPGRTQMINIFTIDEKRRLADLPGYGFAKVPAAVQQKWQKTIDAYIKQRESLKGLILVMDIRHPLRELDQVLLEYCHYRQLPVHILLNKADKLSKNETQKTFFAVQKALGQFKSEVSLQIFSASKKNGLKELHIVLDKWYEYSS